eukprot:CAMPEP_0184679972 /NCGR_PEP_ID=MMETSP0312-20130426/2837_1 /TAXON_ID=31354 /ORGANISM="Compsopogon coeruleus, Strain SAG 36.94" /LENGTH=228 /DNA_ID=CAMNT_0027129773 /DNA_START=249 /DNA_END=935 /DNA_ORIENTATION=-
MTKGGCGFVDGSLVMRKGLGGSMVGVCGRRGIGLRMSVGWEEEVKTTRREWIRLWVGGVFAVGLAGPAMAEPSGGVEGAIAKTFFSKPGFNGDPNLTPQSVRLEQDKLKEKDIQGGIVEIRKFREDFSQVETAFGKDNQLDILPDLRRIFVISALRDALNRANAAFDEETQRKTDILVRTIIQDIQELQNAAKVKPDQPRTPRRIEKTTKWLGKVGEDFDKLLSLYPA